MRTIAVTGASGFVGERLIERLCARDDVEKVVAIDVRAVDARPDVDARTLDVRDPGLAKLLVGCDAVVHLAFADDSTRDTDVMHDVNVRGTRNVLEGADSVGVPRVVVLSDAMVYGAHGDNDVPLDESCALRGNDELGSARHRVEVERWIEQWAGESGRPSVAVLRPALLGGPGASNIATRRIESRPFVMIRGHRPPLQLCHVDDLVSAIELLLDQVERTGAYNVASEGWLSSDEVLSICGVRSVDLPVEAAHQLAQQAWRVGLSPFAPGLLAYAMHPWVVAVDRLVDAGWRPRHSNRDVLAGLVAEHHGHVALGPLRVRRKDVTVGVIATGAVAVGLLALRRVRARR